MPLRQYALFIGLKCSGRMPFRVRGSHICQNSHQKGQPPEKNCQKSVPAAEDNGNPGNQAPVNPGQPGPYCRPDLLQRGNCGWR